MVDIEDADGEVQGDDGERSRFGQRTVAWMLAGAVVLGVLSTALALTVTPLTTDHVTLWNAPTADSHFTVNEYDVDVKGKDKVDVSVTLKNTDTSSHEANVTVQLLDSSGSVLQEDSNLTGSVGADSTWSHTFKFKGSGLASDYEESALIVDDVS